MSIYRHSLTYLSWGRLAFILLPSSWITEAITHPMKASPGQYIDISWLTCHWVDWLAFYSQAPEFTEATTQPMKVSPGQYVYIPWLTCHWVDWLALCSRTLESWRRWWGPRLGTVSPDQYVEPVSLVGGSARSTDRWWLCTTRQGYHVEKCEWFTKTYIPLPQSLNWKRRITRNSTFKTILLKGKNFKCKSSNY